MGASQLEVKNGRNYSAAQIGDWTGLDQYTMTHPLISRPIPGKLFLRKELGLTGMETSVGKIRASTEVPFYHKHQENEELYLFIKGRGDFQVDGERIEIREGTVIRVAPDGVRTLRCGPDEDLYYIVVQSRAGSLRQGDIQDGPPLKEPVKWPTDS